MRLAAHCLESRPRTEGADFGICQTFAASPAEPGELPCWFSEAHLHRYLVEWDFKFNTRNMTDGERAALALKGAEGKRLTYRQPHKTAHA